jgi:hypothetical protein
MRIDGMRPVFAASYTHVRETASRAATSAGFNSLSLWTSRATRL